MKSQLRVQVGQSEETSSEEKLEATRWERERTEPCRHGESEIRGACAAEGGAYGSTDVGFTLINPSRITESQRESGGGEEKEVARGGKERLSSRVSRVLAYRTTSRLRV